MAYAGFSVWAIVFQQLSNNTIDTLILWITVKWRPVKKISWFAFKKSIIIWLEITSIIIIGYGI
ncbi:MAG: oligosaccharide flippase family protein [Holdemanella porci]